MLFAHIFTTLNRPMRRRASAWILFPRRRSQRQTGPSQDTLKTRLIEYLFGSQKSEEKKKKDSEFGIMHCELFYNARSALYHGVQALGIGEGNEIILQAYTCVSVPNAIIATGAKPIYCDVDPETLNIDPSKIKSLITPNTKAILIQHTFGVSADIEAIQKICADHHIALIEDCCHALGGEYQGQKLGTFGDIAIFSFGRDKIISSVNGGALIINNTEKLKSGKAEKELFIIHHSPFTIFQNLLYIILGQLCKITYRFGIGKFLYYLAGKYHLFPTIVTTAEKQCHYSDFNYTMPNCLTDIALHELDRIDEYNTIRENNNKLYDKLLNGTPHLRGGLRGGEKIGLLRYLYLNPHPQQLAQFMKSHNIILGDRYQQVIAPKGTDYAAAGYTLGSCPIAESIASQSVNLPNHAEIREEDIKKVVELIMKVIK